MGYRVMKPFPVPELGEAVQVAGSVVSDSDAARWANLRRYVSRGFLKKTPGGDTAPAPIPEPVEMNPWPIAKSKPKTTKKTTRKKSAKKGD